MKRHSVFISSVLITLGVIIYGVVDNSGLAALSSKMMAAINDYFSWFYLLGLPLMLVYLLYLALGKYGNVRLGHRKEKPEYSTLSWFAMLFCAGTGIGLVFWSVAEPLTHFTTPPGNIVPGSVDAARFAIRTCFLHWAILPWTCFAVVGLGLAYFQFTKRQNGLMSNLLLPIFGEKLIYGPVGHIIDIFAVLVSVAGVATSLGLGCMQICGGLNYLFGLPTGNTTYLIAIILISVIFISSSISGIGKGIKYLSNINSYLAIALLLLALFVVGPADKMLITLCDGLGNHLQNFVSDCLSVNPFGNNSWVMNWRVFYWAWWIAWAPFVGMFIARISRGRTIREFIIAVMLVPSLLTFLWFSVFGTLSIEAGSHWSLQELAKIASAPDTAVFKIFSVCPMSTILSLLVVALLAIFFITSADSATFSLGMLTSQGALNPPNWKKVVWGILEASMAFVLLSAGSIKPLQLVSIAAALPFLLIMLLMCISLLKELRSKSAILNGR